MADAHGRAVGERADQPSTITVNEVFSWTTTSTWRPILKRLSGQRLSRKRVQEALLSTYLGVEVVHACRTANVSSYYEKGLLPSDSAALDEIAANLLRCPTATEAETHALIAASNKIGWRDHGKLYVSVDSRSLIERHGHYLIYGSERILAIAAHLTGDPSPYRRKLKSFGQPTLFRALLRWQFLPEHRIEDFCRVVVSEFRHVEAYGVTRRLTHSFVLDQKIPPEDLLGHFHPTEICDPMEGNTTPD